MTQFKIFILLVTVIFISQLLSGCAIIRKHEYRQRIIGWEFVRIERQVPDKSCKYIIQDVCGERDVSDCYTWYKKRAKFYGANTVVITEDKRNKSASFYNSWGPTFKFRETMTSLADFYDCPEYKLEENK